MRHLGGSDTGRQDADLVVERIDLAVQFAEREKISYPATMLFLDSHSVAPAAVSRNRPGIRASGRSGTGNVCCSNTARDGERWTFRRDDEEAQVVVNGNLRFPANWRSGQCALATWGRHCARLDDRCGPGRRHAGSRAARLCGRNDLRIRRPGSSIRARSTNRPKARTFSKFMQSRLALQPMPAPAGEGRPAHRS